MLVTPFGDRESDITKFRINEKTFFKEKFALSARIKFKCW